ncbi:LPXTG cell wall anchor domain-containing protein [Streptomyces spectabilis]|uniref:LPXTG cell wall anchor domain-containing protein n=1 Tax=Streptomyces spectabilis TaxID=68270 RepID=UPI0033D14347
MTHRAHARPHARPLRAAFVASAVAAGVLASPAATAFASESTPKPTAGVDGPAPEVSKESVAKKRAATEEALRDAKRKHAAPRGGVAAGDKPVVKESGKAAPAPAQTKPTVTPRGGVAAGERPATGGDNTPALIGSAAGIALVAGASTLVLRRRATGRAQG